MKRSRYFIPTLKETPAEATLPSHKLMLRAGMIRKSAAGSYLWLPLGLRALRKVETIVREEMNRAGACEISCSVLIPSELMDETGRWERFGSDMFRLEDRHGRDFCLGPTHEEVFTHLVRTHLSSYRDFPITLYQIGRKYRDEVRPRFGVMRGREFLMKDAYSFDVDEEAMQASYDAMVKAYKAIFDRCALDYTMVAADSGAIGGDTSFEFMVKADSGEDEILACCRCGYAANVEKFPCTSPAQTGSTDSADVPAPEEVDTPGVTSIEDLARFLDLSPTRIVKTLLYRSGDDVVALLLRGDHQLSDTKAAAALGLDGLTPATEDEIEAATGGPVGFSGPRGLQGARVVADTAVRGLTDVVIGANTRDRHIKHTSVGRDFEPAEYLDLRQGASGDPCPSCGEPVSTMRGIEVGHVFQLGKVYSEAMKATYLDDQGKSRVLQMGCYGIGVDRTLAAIIEQNHDKDGIIWPLAVAPFQVTVIPLNVKDEAVMETATSLYDQLCERGYDVLLDDRRERAGFKFKDAELVGYPYRLTIGPKGLARGEVEITRRRDLESWSVPVGEAVERLCALLE